MVGATAASHAARRLLSGRRSDIRPGLSGGVQALERHLARERGDKGVAQDVGGPRDGGGVRAAERRRSLRSDRYQPAELHSSLAASPQTGPPGSAADHGFAGAARG